MFKGTPELIAERREEIVNACQQLYQTMSFREITLKEIGNVTSFSRPTIYNYFQTKEEIFLALFEREYIQWTKDLQKLSADIHNPGKEELAEAIADSLQKRKLLLKLLSVNLYDMEDNSRMERLTSFKIVYGQSREALCELMKKAYPQLGEEAITDFIFTFLPYLHGIYPYAFATEKQIEAMDNAGISHPDFTIKGLVKSGLVKMLP